MECDLFSYYLNLCGTKVTAYEIIFLICNLNEHFVNIYRYGILRGITYAAVVSNVSV